jgi:2-(1,2-epoxy-1,2-dihydrophenyl)acetyl-CoA isomerase
MDERVRVSRDENVARVMLNRPQKFNSFDLETVQQFSASLMALAVDDSVKGVVVSGEGKAFCAGGDLQWASRHPAGPSSAFHELAARFHQAILEIRRMGKPVIAAIHGIAAGGGFSLALACDFRVMGRSAVLQQAYTSNGLCIDGGGTFTLPRVVGLARALEIAAFDTPISSDQALAWGLVTQVVEDDRVLEEAVRMARRLTQGSLHSRPNWKTNATGCAPAPPMRTGRRDCRLSSRSGGLCLTAGKQLPELNSRPAEGKFNSP